MQALKWWAQSYLAGIPQITCGFRNDDGFVVDLQDFVTHELPIKASQVHRSWNFKACLNFLDNFLQAIKNILLDCHSHKVVYLFSWNPGDEVIQYAIDHSSQHAFLPEWYTSEFLKY